MGLQVPTTPHAPGQLRGRELFVVAPALDLGPGDVLEPAPLGCLEQLRVDLLKGHKLERGRERRREGRSFVLSCQKSGVEHVPLLEAAPLLDFGPHLDL